MTVGAYGTGRFDRHGRPAIVRRINRASSMVLSRREVRDLWRVAAKAAKANGDIALMKQCQATAKLWS